MKQYPIFRILLAALIGVLSLTIFELWLLNKTTKPNSLSPQEFKELQNKEGLENLHFELVDPALSPQPIQTAVLRGYDLMINTNKLLPDYVGDQLTCANCHIAGGNTTGGKNGGISLVGVASAYPSFNPRANKVMTLQNRIESCFQRSMNGKSLPIDSSDMTALVTYLTWISKGTPIYTPLPWRGLKPLKTAIQGNPQEGKKLYEIYCSDCHGASGEGQNDQTLIIPPVWGDKSFNKGAGMAVPETMSAFLYWNMPYGMPDLTEEQAIHIASYVLEQPRPEFKSKTD